MVRRLRPNFFASAASAQLLAVKKPHDFAVAGIPRLPGRALRLIKDTTEQGTVQAGVRKLTAGVLIVAKLRQEVEAGG